MFSDTKNKKSLNKNFSNKGHKPKKEALMSKKKAQAALEFLMTYGWAIIVVLVAISALVYFGILDLSIFFPSKCVLPAGIACLDFDVKTSTATVVLQNNVGETISLDSVIVASRESVPCSYNSPLVLRNRERATITLADCNHGAAGKRFDGEITVAYTNLDTSLTHKSVGDIATKLSEGPQVTTTTTTTTLATTTTTTTTTTTMPWSCANFVCPSLASGINDLSADPIQVWHNDYGNGMDCIISSCSCPAGTTMEKITYQVDVEPPKTNDYLEICGVANRYSGTSAATVSCGAQSVRFRFKSNGGTSYNDGSTQYEGGKITMINCVTPAPPPEATIKVAVEQMDDFADFQAGGDDVVNQLNDRTYVSGLGAVKVDGINIDTLSELNTYDVVVIGSNGWYGYDDYEVFGNYLKTWVSNGHGVVAVGEIISELNPFTDEGIIDILPVQTGGTIGGDGGINNLNPTHPVTQGVGTFSAAFTQTCPQHGYGKPGSSRVGDCKGAPQGGTPGVVVWEYGAGNGRVVYIAEEYMRNGYSELRTGNADKLLEQAVKWASKK